MQVKQKVIEAFLEVPDLDLLPEADDQDVLHQVQGHGALRPVLQPEVPLPAPGGRAVEPHPCDLRRAEAGQVAAAEAGQGVARGRREVALGRNNTLGHTGL